jgi:ferric-dicitrate binding protein FerR (iron transport regulator)
MTDQELDLFRSIFAAQRAIGKASTTSRAAMQAAKEAQAMDRLARTPKYAATLREHCNPQAKPRRDWAGIAIATACTAFVLAAWALAMTSDFGSLP